MIGGTWYDVGIDDFYYEAQPSMFACAKRFGKPLYHHRIDFMGSWCAHDHWLLCGLGSCRIQPWYRHDS